MNLLSKVLSSVLCCVIAFGYAPAWLHVSVCHDHHRAIPAEGNVVHACTSCCGPPHTTKPWSSDDLRTPGKNEPPSEEGHDSGTCFVCQSLGNVNGVTSQSETQLQSTRVCEPVFITAEFHLVQRALAIASPRGPPVRV